MNIETTKQDNMKTNGNGASVASNSTQLREEVDALIEKWKKHSAIASGTNLQLEGHIPIKVVKADLQKLLRI